MKENIRPYILRLIKKCQTIYWYKIQIDTKKVLFCQKVYIKHVDIKNSQFLQKL